MTHSNWWLPVIYLTRCVVLLYLHVLRQPCCSFPPADAGIHTEWFVSNPGKRKNSAHCLRHRAYTSAFIASINFHPSVSKGISNNTSDNKSSSIFSIDNRATNFIHTKLCKRVYWIMIYTEEISLILKTLYVERRNIHHFLIACQRFSSARW